MSGVAVDDCHADLTYGLIRSHKPSNILEMGVGSGTITKVILKAVSENENGQLSNGYKKAKVTLVDNWYDWNGTKPTELIDQFESNVSVIDSSELNFVFNTRETYDFIFSDADHWNTDKWFDYVYDRLLNDNGILIYHDVSMANNFPSDDLRFPNLENIMVQCKKRNLNYIYFNKSSIKTERCYRGYIVIQKQIRSIAIHEQKLVIY